MSDQPPVIRSQSYRWVQAGFIVLALGLLAWPVAAFVAIFLFDAPMRGSLDEAVRYALACSVWSYPVLWFAGWMIFRAAAKQGRSGSALAWPLAMPLAPMIVIAAAIVFGW